MFSFFLKAEELSLFGHSTRHTKHTKRERERERERETFFIEKSFASKRARARRNTHHPFKTKTHLKNNHGDHVREIVPASLLEERDAHFDGAREFFLSFLVGSERRSLSED